MDTVPPPALPARLVAQLLRAAEEARANAYAPYSRFRVGAAVLAGGNLYRGCNVENASYGLTVCAERVAAFAAVVAGNSTIEAVALVSDAEGPITPCGACRQVLYEFGPDMTIVTAGGGHIETHRLRDLLPGAFGPNDLSDGAPG